MSKLSVIFLSLVIFVTALAPRLAEATCTQSQIHVVPQNLNIGPAVPVIWMIGPACDVIETGLLLGTDPAKLAPAAQPTYNARSSYSQPLTVAETRPYWIAAHARNADGRSSSPPRKLCLWGFSCGPNSKTLIAPKSGHRCERWLLGDHGQ